MRAIAAIAAALLLAACTRTPDPVHYLAEGQPQTLAEWNVVQVRDGRLVPNDRVLPYDLATPLFTDYAHKLRTVWMPAGQAARYRADGDFEFPVGTILSKTFYYPVAAGGKGGNEVLVTEDAGAGTREGRLELAKVRLIETRLLVHRADGWIALPYVWNAAQTEARLMRAGELVPLTLVAADGSRRETEYEVPDQNQCGGCHGDDMKTRALLPLGPKARHLNHDVDDVDGRANQLERWTQAGYLVGAPVPASAPRNADWRDPKASLDARARAYLDINCGHCHNPKGPGNTSGLWLDAATDEPLRLGRCKLPIAAGKGTGDRRHDIVPGQPDASILAYRMASDDPSAMMPELGRSVVHDEGVRLIHDWIAAMDGNCDGDPPAVATASMQSVAH